MFNPHSLPCNGWRKIQLAFNAFIFDSIYIIQVTFYPGFNEYHVGQGFIKKPNIETVEYSTIMITQIVFGKNTLDFSK